jgi:hypothetical protein
VSAFDTDPSTWNWYYNRFLGTGAFQTNTWGPQTAVLDNDGRSQPAMRRVPATFTSGGGEWYSWQHDLRQNADIDVLASVGSPSFPRRECGWTSCTLLAVDELGTVRHSRCPWPDVLFRLTT